MLWLEIDSLREQAHTLTDTIKTMLHDVSAVSGAVQTLAANDAAHLQRIELLTQDIRELRALLTQQQQGQNQAQLTSERAQAGRIIQFRSDLQGWMMYLVSASVGALLAHFLLH